MSAPKVDVELDERTKDELQPPCEFRSYRPGANGLVPCDRTADLIARSICPTCGPKVDFLCKPHGGEAMMTNVVCSACKSRLDVRALEPLR